MDLDFFIQHLSAKIGRNSVEDFATAVLNQYRNELIKNIELEKLDRSNDQWDKGFNSALDTIIEIIKRDSK